MISTQPNGKHYNTFKFKLFPIKLFICPSRVRPPDSDIPPITGQAIYLSENQSQKRFPSLTARDWTFFKSYWG